MGRGITRLADAGKVWVLLFIIYVKYIPWDVQVPPPPLPQVDCRGTVGRQRHPAKANGLRPQIQASRGFA